MNGFQKRRENKINDILTAANELFSAKGIKAVSIADIAKKANVSQVSIYNFFESKENLARQVFIKLMDDTMTGSEDLVKSDLSFNEKIKKMQSFSVDASRNFHDNFKQIEFIKDPNIQKFLEEYGKNKTLPLYLKLVEQGRNENQLDKDISTDSIILFMEIINTALQSNISPKVRSDLGKLFFYGLFGRSDN
ncbi:TetR family transcriptional regulator [Anaerocolumna sedimenticola]|uniref:TetR family transcriptional regulator n=1 Tax=Anaerocolumna sedimenticola TaxID=2696063 RepID=A0A6P1TUX6_9FIRM|nr:TetR/AcrR family transcriptional regulator [Anaerocolumna sedimenticola]QHQ63235.1 TetR family transcriptional regulator [Anaerocolumna sedimenticola]